MPCYLFQLGHQPQISTAEIQAVLSLEHPSTHIIEHQTNKYLFVDSKKELNAENLINKLGGTIKISSQFTVQSSELKKNIVNYLNKNQSTGKIEFSLTGGDKNLPLTIKKELKMLDRSVRYIEPKNTATILHNKLVEKKTDLTIINKDIFVTLAIQPFTEFSERDYGRPGIDDKSGMLPPKLARIMVNLSQATKDEIILDPFCGSGTVLTEALTMGYNNLIGSDISEKAIQDTEKNIQWLIANYHLSAITYHLNVADATKISANLQPVSVDTIITEPYLGNPLHGNESKVYIQKQTEELNKTNMYGTPTIFINGKAFVGPKPYRVYRSAINKYIFF